jgi:hypothetical protein
MLFSDVTVDRGTGQLALRGEFPNKDGLLLPGMYVRVTLGLGEDPRPFSCLSVRCSAAPGRPMCWCSTAGHVQCPRADRGHVRLQWHITEA